MIISLFMLSWALGFIASMYALATSKALKSNKNGQLEPRDATMVIVLAFIWPMSMSLGALYCLVQWMRKYGNLSS